MTTVLKHSKTHDSNFLLLKEGRQRVSPLKPGSKFDRPKASATQTIADLLFIFKQPNTPSVKIAGQLIEG
jgi:hypothetical protein